KPSSNRARVHTSEEAWLRRLVIAAVSDVRGRDAKARCLGHRRRIRRASEGGRGAMRLVEVANEREAILECWPPPGSGQLQSVAILQPRLLLCDARRLLQGGDTESKIFVGLEDLTVFDRSTAFPEGDAVFYALLANQIDVSGGDG